MRCPLGFATAISELNVEGSVRVHLSGATSTVITVGPDLTGTPALPVRQWHAVPSPSSHPPLKVSRRVSSYHLFWLASSPVGRHMSGSAAALLCLVCLFFTACSKPEPKRQYIAPRSFATMADLVPQIQAIIEGDVENIGFDNQDCEGPRTVIQLTGVKTLLGDQHESRMTLRVFGGPLANGSFVSVSELPQYVLGAHYVLFLRNTDWRFSPVLGDLAFRVEAIAGKQVLLNTQGHAITGVSEAGIETSTLQLTEPVGLNFKGVTKPLPGSSPQSDELGTTTPCQATEQKSSRCPAATDSGEIARAEALRESGRFSRPQLLPKANQQAVASALSTDQVVKSVSDWAQSHGTRIGGYFALAPKIGCWDTTIVTPARRK
jgi:hypothetical protein